MCEFDIVALRAAVTAGKIRWQLHALERMMERGISRVEVLTTILEGEPIETYGEDKPFPSVLIFSMKIRPIHVVAAIDANSGTCHVITAYIPDTERFCGDYKTRRRRP